MQATPEPSFRDIYTVSRLNREVRTVLEGSFPLLWLEAEISNLTRPASGHLYFTLKDEAAQVRCAMFRNKNLYLPFTPKNGMQVLVRARLGLYETRGEFQIIIEHMEEAGDGALRRAFDALKERLAKEGLFDAAHKKAIPVPPKQVGVITSPSGAAVRDVLTTLKRRFPALPVIIYPVAVQGSAAAGEIAHAIATANQRQECDVLLLVRGGGSLEDLWSFNEEVVARAMQKSLIPIVSGIGHEVDFSIADFVADYRAPTPTAAAEYIAPDQQAWRRQLQKLQQRFAYIQASQLRLRQQHLKSLRSRMVHPGQYLQAMSQRLDELFMRQQKSLRQRLLMDKQQLRHIHRRLRYLQPSRQLSASREKVIDLLQRLRKSQQQLQRDARQQLRALGRTLDAVSPLATLGRGYAIIQTEQGKVVRDSSDVTPGQHITSRLHRGTIVSRVEKTEKPND
ncbi:MAG: exodeoxyribonuclease VII large subunit [Gammaproteobacteria bacterium]